MAQCMDFSRVKVGLDKLGLTHLIFADDLMIFTRGDVPSVTAFLQTSETFSHWSGLSANNDKTDVYFGGVPATVKHQILQVTGFSERRFPFRYLGLPLHTARNTFDNYGSLITKIQTHIQHWAAKSFSYAGIVQLLNSVIFGLTNFWCSSVLLPKNIIKAINRLCKDFFWNYDDGRQRMDTHNKPNHSESYRSILAVKEEILGRTGIIPAASVLLNSWVKNGKFHIKAAYDWFRTPATALPWAHALNSQFLIPSHRLITTLALQEKLATVDKIAARGAVCYHIWAERNARIFLGAEKTTAQLIHIIRNTVSSRILGKVPSKDYEKAVHRLNFL
ncbi:uncharacterized protein LOC141629401 [Silene latifolia]|uniref:uncharacterized protein LOC141629401 n=1 Tax=Silene latifolia TaxID=37657 RepID=UPI003D76D9E6